MHTRFETKIVDFFKLLVVMRCYRKHYDIFGKKGTRSNERISLAFCPVGESVRRNPWVVVVGFGATSTEASSR